MQNEQHYYENKGINPDPREQHYENKAINTDPREQQQFDRGSKLTPKKSHMGGFLLALLLIVCLVGGGLFAFTSFSKQQSVADRAFTLTGHSQLTVTNDSGRVSIHAGNTDRIIVHSTRFVSGFGASLDNIHTDYTQNGNAISISGHEDNAFLSLGLGGVDFDISVPNTTDLTLHTGSGDIHVTDITGQSKADTGSGNIEANNINGQTTLSTGSGNIQIEQVKLSGQSSLHTGSGNIRLTGSLAPNGNYLLDTGSGNVTVNMPADSAFQLKTKTGSGDLHNSFGSNQVGTSPYAELSIQTGSGNIKVNKQ